MIVEHVDPVAAMTVLNSFCFDFALRLRTAGTNVSFTYIQPMPVPSAEIVNRLQKIETQFAWNKGITHISQDQSLWPALWSANRAVAEAYGLNADDFGHVLEAFPGFARKRLDLHEFMTRNLLDWKASER